MDTPYAKIFGIAGLMFALCGLLFLLEARRIGDFDNAHVPINKYIENIGWIFTIVGYLMQIVAIALS